MSLSSVLLHVFLSELSSPKATAKSFTFSHEGRLDCQSRGLGFKSQRKQKFGLRFLLHLQPLANAAMMSILTAHCQWEDETMRERTGHLPSHTEAKKTKSLTLHTHGCP